VWNEPNTVNYFHPRPDAIRYGMLLAATYRAIKAVEPDATVLSGGLAPAEDNGKDIAPLSFLRSMYSTGANRYFDAFAIHPYTYPALPNDPSTSEWNTAQRMWQMRDVMVAGGDAGKSVWITECGAPTGTGRRAVSEQLQAETLRMILATAENTPWIAGAYVYSMRDSGTDLGDIEQNFGILKHDFTAKAAYDVVTKFGS
jgi:polysaccharide biosynthesis protein PslG